VNFSLGMGIEFPGKVGAALTLLLIVTVLEKSLSAEMLQTIADQFAHQGNITGIQAFGSGNINDTFLVALDDPLQTRFVLQRINTLVFRNPEAVMQNMRTFTNHMHERLGQNNCDRRWEVPRVIGTKIGGDHFEVAGDFWRAISFVENSESFDVMHDEDHAWEVGFALGQFHDLISDLEADRLVDTLPGFHIAPGYLAQYQAVLPTTPVTATDEVNYCMQFVADRASWCGVLETAKAEGKLPLRLMHGDPKVNNIMFDKTTGKAVAVVDLDTVKPGLVHYDIGDCLRSGCNLLGEETRDWRSVTFDIGLCEAILSGYLSVARSFLMAADYDFLFDGIRLIAFELGLRFFTDHLAGDAYFKVKYPGHNLARALVQFQLTQSIEEQEAEIARLIQRMRDL
jgi:Ser/Thr protein kinase RdoA (MazF antagonist)